jgi:methyl coenzyme M reductase subunit C
MLEQEPGQEGQDRGGAGRARRGGGPRRGRMGRGQKTEQNVEARPPTHLHVTSPVCLLTTQAPWRQRLHLFTSHLGPSK